MTNKISKEELHALFEECREEIENGKKCDAIQDISKENGWVDPVALALSTDIPHCLAGKNMEIISLEIDEKLKKLGFTKKEREQKVNSLYGYYLIEKKVDLKLGRFIRWISSSTDDNENKLTNGAFLVDIEKRDGKGWNLLCKNWKTQFIRIAFHPGMVFQQLNREEIMVMLLSSNL